MAIIRSLASAARVKMHDKMKKETTATAKDVSSRQYVIRKIQRLQQRLIHNPVIIVDLRQLRRHCAKERINLPLGDFFGLLCGDCVGGFPFVIQVSRHAVIHN